MIVPRFGFSVSPGDANGVAREAAEAELLGYDRIGIWDSPSLFREPWVVLTAMANSTRAIHIGTWVTNPLSRHPLVTASALSSLEEVAPGRVYMGIGSGGTGVWHLGKQAASVAQLEKYVLTVRQLLTEGSAEYEGETSRLFWGQKKIPIIIAAHGPKSIELAGRIGDGVIFGLGVTPDVVQNCLQLLERSAHQAGRALSEIDVWFTCFWFVDPEPGVAQKQGTWAAASFAAHFARSGVENKFVPDKYKDGLKQVGAAYDYITHGAVPEEQKDQYTELAERLGVREYLQRRFVFCGTPDEVEAQVREAIDAGARNFDGAIDAELPAHRERIKKWARYALVRFKPGLR